MDVFSYKNRALFTDFYELTMVNGYFEHEYHEKLTTFELFFRRSPFRGGFAIACGMNDVVKYLKNFSFSQEDLQYLLSLNTFSENFIDFLQKIKLTEDCSVLGVPEGTIVFPYEPILQVTAPLAFAQLIESAILNIVNYQTLIATKAARICLATKRSDNVMEFGLRRAQGDGGITGSRAAVIGGCASTSNTFAGKHYGLPVNGTHAHSWVQSFPTELEAFRAYADVFPNNTTLLVDTYNVLKSGVPNAIKVALEMKEKNQSLKAIRIDSGDLAWLTIESARMLDKAGLTAVKIVLSSDLDEYLIESIVNQILNDTSNSNDNKFKENLLSRIFWGVGTNLVTGSGNTQAALGGVYKLVEIEKKPVIKISENRAKTTDPGRKKIYRLADNNGFWIADVLTLQNESSPKEGDIIFHRSDPTKFISIDTCSANELLIDLIAFYDDNDKNEEDIWLESKNRVQEQLATIDRTHLRFLNPHIYKLSLSEELYNLKTNFLQQN
ncbi:MAG: nicotinate phosphoribosyltransferase [Candidatus Hodarchaeales archaeon]|jgi:nicotinate phosphoribosyltransferase